MKKHLTLFVLVCALLHSASGLAESDITLKADPLVSFAPTNITLTVHITRVPENRLIRIECDSDNYYRATEIQLDGQASAATFTMNKMLRGIPAGEYQCGAALVRTDRGPAIARAHFTVS